MALTLRLKSPSNVPIEVEGITPDALANKSIREIEKLKIFNGNRSEALAEFFDVHGDAKDGRHRWEGDLRGVHWIGAKMTTGSLHVAGSGGRHLGSEMSGGEIVVDGDAGDWVGGEMRGGLIHVRGRAGHLIGAAYRGSQIGMKGGTILIDGDVGNEIGHTMRRGLISVGGNAGDLVGFNMRAGSIFVFGSAGIRHGAGMRRGTIGFFGSNPPLLTSFRYACRFEPTVLQLAFRFLQRRDFRFDEELFDTPYSLFNGDLIEGGRGEILLRDGDSA